MGTDFVNQAGGAGGVAEDLADRSVRENILAGPGVIKMPSDIIPRLGPVVMVKAAADVEALSDRKSVV